MRQGQGRARGADGQPHVGDLHVVQVDVELTRAGIDGERRGQVIRQPDVDLVRAREPGPTLGEPEVAAGAARRTDARAELVVRRGRVDGSGRAAGHVVPGRTAVDAERDRLVRAAVDRDG